MALITLLGLVLWAVFALFFQTTSKHKSAIAPENLPYVEKMANFSLQAFNEAQQVDYVIKSGEYYSFKMRPALLIDPNVDVYDELGVLGYTLSSKRADYYINQGAIEFQHAVNIHSNTGLSHHIQTQKLWVDLSTNFVQTQQKVTYLGETGKIVSQGMEMRLERDKMTLLGKVVVNQNTGARILTRELNIDQSDGKKHYVSNHPTTYTAGINKVYAKGLNLTMDTQQMTLLGKVKIIHGREATILTRDLRIDQADGREMYRTDKNIKYQTKKTQVRAKAMVFDVTRQIITLTGEVVGRYD